MNMNITTASLQAPSRPTAPSDVWNAFNNARTKATGRDHLLTHGITADRLRGWHALSAAQQESIAATLQPFHRQHI